MLDLIINPFATILLFFYSLLGQNVFLAIVAFTITIRLALVPLNLRMQRSAQKMQELSPMLKELQEKYKNDREMLAQKQMELYREMKINPFAPCLPALIQLPILLGLWRAITSTLAASPNELLHLADRIIVPGLDHLVPLQNQFLWMNLAVPDPYLLLPFLVVVTSWVQQKLMTPPAPVSKRKPGDPEDPSEQAMAMTRQMTTYLPLMLGLFALSYSSGISIYLIVGNIFGIVQYALMGKADFRRLWGGDKSVEEDTSLIEPNGRRRKAGITDTRWVEGKGPKTVEAIVTTEDTRSERVAKAKRAAKTK